MLYSIALFSLSLFLIYLQVILPVKEMKRVRSKERFNSSYRAFKAISVKRYHPEYRSQGLIEIFEDPHLDHAFDALDTTRINESGQEIWWPIKSEME